MSAIITCWHPDQQKFNPGSRPPSVYELPRSHCGSAELFRQIRSPMHSVCIKSSNCCWQRTILIKRQFPVALLRRINKRDNSQALLLIDYHHTRLLPSVRQQRREERPQCQLRRQPCRGDNHRWYTHTVYLYNQILPILLRLNCS